MAEAAGPGPPGDHPGPLPAALELLPAGPVAMRLAAPASKSVTNRALLCAALAEGTSRLHGAAASDDADAMATALTALGAEVGTGRSSGRAGPGGPDPATRAAHLHPGTWTVQGTGGRLHSPAGPLDARLSGTTLRFLAAAAVLAPAG
ncbi:MAG TPA: hypothetical protein VHW42_06410, partial [Actinomycetes bacterium]|nr:hypothetical protein [Actinomycetes bacterium]